MQKLCTASVFGNLSNTDTNGTEESVHISEVSLFQGFKKLFLGKDY